MTLKPLPSERSGEIRAAQISALERWRRPGVLRQGGEHSSSRKGVVVSEQPKGEQNTDIEELNEDGVGGTVGKDSSFEPEEDDKGAEGSQA